MILKHMIPHLVKWYNYRLRPICEQRWPRIGSIHGLGRVRSKISRFCWVGLGRNKKFHDFDFRNSTIKLL